MAIFFFIEQQEQVDFQQLVDVAAEAFAQQQGNLNLVGAEEGGDEEGGDILEQGNLGAEGGGDILGQGNLVVEGGDQGEILEVEEEHSIHDIGMLFSFIRYFY